MSSITIYHNPRCGKSRTTLKLLREEGVEPTIVEYLTEPPDQKELTTILKKLGMKPAELIRRKEAKEAEIDVKNLTDKELIAAMKKNPIIIERPIVVQGSKAVLGRPPEQALTLL